MNPNVVFVFGSNLAGRHGKGAAEHAARYYGAEIGVGEGPTGRAYALPTKDRDLRPLPLQEIAAHVEAFLAHARSRPVTTFLVTQVGCGLAGYEPQQIAPFFASAPANCFLSAEWIPHYE